MLRHDLTNGRHLMPVARVHHPPARTRTSSTCGGNFNRVSTNDLNQKLLWRAETLAPMSDARKRLFRKLAITLLLINIERLEELDRIAEDDAERDGDWSHAEKVPSAYRQQRPVVALASYSIRNAKPSQHSPADQRPTPIEPSPVVDSVQIAGQEEEIWHRNPKKTLSWRIKPFEMVRHNNATKAIVGDRKKLKRQSFAIDQLEGNLIARVTTV